MNNITLYSSQVYLAEDNSNPDSYIAKFVICDFGCNKNGYALSRDGIDSWLSTLKNKPLVGKIKLRIDGTYDFTGHNMKIVERVDEDGNTYQDAEFDTDAFGSFFDVSIEKINDKEYIVASCEIWKRFHKACSIIINRIRDGTLHTSWEIAVEESHQGIVDGFMTTIVDAGRFIGHCLLGKNVEPAYDSSGLLAIAEADYDMEITKALSEDILCQNSNLKENNKEEQSEMAKQNNAVVAENVTETPTNTDSHTTATEKINQSVQTTTSNNVGTENTSVKTTAQLTEWDLRDKIREACRTKLGKWCYISYHFPVDKEVWCEYDGAESELDYVKFTYAVSNDVVSVSEPTYVKLTVSIAEINAKISELNKEVETAKAELDLKNEAITKASETIQNLNTQISELTPYKEQVEVAEKKKIEEKIAAEKESLKQKLLKGNLFTEAEIAEKNIKDLIEARDVSAINSLIADKFVASFDVKDNAQDSVDTASAAETTVTATANLETEDAETDVIGFMGNILFN